MDVIIRKSGNGVEVFITSHEVELTYFGRQLEVFVNNKLELDEEKQFEVVGYTVKKVMITYDEIPRKVTVYITV
ncbi:MAG: hypothetical protein QW794_05555 [Thermosphaera sp.]